MPPTAITLKPCTKHDWTFSYIVQPVGSLEYLCLECWYRQRQGQYAVENQFKIITDPSRIAKQREV